MDNAEFSTLQIKAAVAPQMETWPEGNLEVSLKGDKPTAKGDLHWSTLRSCVEDARARVLKALGAMAAIDDDKNLSRDGKAAKKQEIAEAAIADLEKSKSLDNARASVEQQVKGWDEELGLSTKPPESVGESVQLSEIRAHISAMKGNRIEFITKHAGDPRVVAAVLGGPAFLSGLTEADTGVLKTQIAKRNAPEVAEAKDVALKALAHAEAGWRAALRQIAERAGLSRGRNGQ